MCYGCGGSFLSRQKGLEALPLFELSRAFHQATRDAHTASLLYAATAKCGDAMLQREGVGEAGLAILHAMREYRQDYKDVLWQRAGSDPEAVAALRLLYSGIHDLVP